MNLGFWASGRAEDLIFSVFKQAKQSDHAASGAELEKEEGGGERRDQRSENRAHGQVALGARYVRFGFFLARKLILGLCNFNLPFYNKQRKGILK